MRSVEEIIERVKNPPREDMLCGVTANDLLVFLTFEEARPFLKPEATEAEWNEGRTERDTAGVVSVIKDYMPFAWGKANDRRGLSAVRSLVHMQNWLWLLNVDLNIAQYEYYGKPQLRGICEALDIDWRALDDGHWTNTGDGEGIEPQPGVAIKIPEVA